MGLYDTIVLGGGVMGAAAAETLGRRGRKAVLLERFEPAHLGGSSHGDGRIIRYSYPEAVYVEMAGHAYRGWERVEKAAGATLVETTGGWDCAQDDSAELAELEASFRRAGIAHERLTAAESGRRFPHFALPEGSEALYQPNGGIVRASRAVATLWELARAAGVEALRGERATAIDADRSRVVVKCESGREFRARSLVLSAGGWARGLLAGLGLELPLVVTEEVVSYYAPRSGAPDHRLDHRLGAMPTLIDYHGYEAGEGEIFYALPQIDVPGVKIGWHRGGAEIDPDRPRGAHPENLEKVREFIARRLPHLDPEPIEVVTCLYTNTPDHHFILDQHPDLPNVAVGAGFSGHGFKFAPVVGEILTALVLGEDSPVELETFSLGRFAGDAGLEKRKSA